MSELPSGWKKESIGNLVELAQGVAINVKTNHVLCKKLEGLPLLKINNLQNNTIDQYANPKLVPQKAILEIDDIIFTRTGQVGWVFTNKIGILHNNSFKVIPSEKLAKKFLYWFLKQKSIFNYVQKVASGSAQPDLNHGAFKTISIKYPTDIKEQKAIANILSSFDNKIELLKEQNRTLETLSQAIFKEWFVDSDEKFVQISEFINFNPIEKINRNEEYLFFDMKTLSTTSMSINEGVYKKSSSGTSFRENDTLFSKITPCVENGKTGFVFDLKGEELARGSTEFIIMRAKENGSPYINYCLSRYLAFRNYAIKAMTGTSGRQRIPIERLKNYKIRFNPIIVKDFNNLIKPIFKKIKNNSSQIQTLQKTRDTLLPKLMSGKLRVKEFEDD